VAKLRVERYIETREVWGHTNLGVKPKWVIEAGKGRWHKWRWRFIARIATPWATPSNLCGVSVAAAVAKLRVERYIEAREVWGHTNLGVKPKWVVEAASNNR
jgi:predicted membrane chloride channel (bestrophin family)